MDGNDARTPTLQACEGCGRRVCGPDDAIKTTTRRYFVCGTCYPTLVSGWRRGGRS